MGGEDKEYLSTKEDVKGSDSGAEPLVGVWGKAPRS